MFVVGCPSQLWGSIVAEILIVWKLSVFLASLALSQLCLSLVDSLLTMECITFAVIWKELLDDDSCSEKCMAARKYMLHSTNMPSVSIKDLSRVHSTWMTLWALRFVLAPALALPKSDMCSPWRKDRELTKPFTILSGSTFSIFLTGDILVFLLLVCFCDIGRTVSIFLVKGYFSAECKASFPLSFFCCSMHETSKVRNCYEGESSDMRVNTTFPSFLLSELLFWLAEGCSWMFWCRPLQFGHPWWSYAMAHLFDEGCSLSVLAAATRGMWAGRQSLRGILTWLSAKLPSMFISLLAVANKCWLRRLL